MRGDIAVMAIKHVVCKERSPQCTARIASGWLNPEFLLKFSVSPCFPVGDAIQSHSARQNKFFISCLSR